MFSRKHFRYICPKGTKGSYIKIKKHGTKNEKEHYLHISHVSVRIKKGYLKTFLKNSANCNNPSPSPKSKVQSRKVPDVQFTSNFHSRLK